MPAAEDLKYADGAVSIAVGHSPRGLRNEAASEARMKIRAFVVSGDWIHELEATVFRAAGRNLSSPEMRLDEPAGICERRQRRVAIHHGWRKGTIARKRSSILIPAPMESADESPRDDCDPSRCTRQDE